MTEESSSNQSFAVKGQYVKDLSFENPRSPQSLIPTGKPPAIEVNVDLKAQKLQDDVYEMTLKITTRAITDNSTAKAHRRRSIPEGMIVPRG